MEKRLTTALFFLLLFSFSKLYSQNNQVYKFDKITASDFAIQSRLIDSNTNAVIIADIGNTEFEGNNKGWFTYIFKRKKRIKIINKKAFDLATENILLYQDEDDKEKLEDVIGTTYNLTGGQVVATKLDKNQLFTEKYDKNHSAVKFAMPSVSEGSIIEYSYAIKSNFIFNIPSWEYQNPEHPTLWSEYNITIPSLLSYMSIRQGRHSFFIDKTSDGYKTYLVNAKHEVGLSQIEDRLSVSTPIVIHKWVMKDIPGIKVEDFITTPLNFINKINFQLYQTYDGSQMHDVYNTWQKAVDEMLKKKDFGVALDEGNDLCGELVKTIVNENDDLLKKAKDIYSYVQKKFTCNNRHNMFVKTTLRDVVKKKSGNTGEINLLLTGLLRQINIPAFPVILSDRAAGRTFANYPQMDLYNYVICKIKLGDEEYYLDATEPLLGFAKLPLKCYNGFAKVISKDSAAVILSTDNLKENRSVAVFIIKDSASGYAGSVTKNYSYYESLHAREMIAKSSPEDFKKRIEEESSSENIKIKNIVIDSLENLELPVTVNYDLDIKITGNDDIIYFNPMLDEAIKQNPFAAAEREFPVEMPYTLDNIYTLNMEVPHGYMVDEVPKSTRVKLNEQDGLFEYLVSVNDNTIQMKCRLQLNKANFSSDNYQSLREFYGHVVKKEAEQIVFKKIKK